MDIVEFIKARLDEDESMARAATQAPWWHNPEKQWLGPEAFEKFDLSKGEEYVGYGESPLSGCIAATGPASHRQSMADAAHIARHDPARVLREVEATRAIVARYADALRVRDDDFDPADEAKRKDRYSWGWADWHAEALEPVVRLLALPYSDHPDWREEWASPTS